MSESMLIPVMLKIVINATGATRKIPPRENRIAPVTCKSFDIIRSISYYSLNKSFNIKPIENYNMTFKLKAWMIYLIGVAVVPVVAHLIIVKEWYEWDEFYFSLLGNTLLYGLVLLLFYYIGRAIYKRSWKKDQNTK